MKKGKGRVKAQLFESDIREMSKVDAMQYWCSIDVPRLRSHSIGEHLSMTAVWRAIASSKLNTCKTSNRFKKAIVSSGSMIVGSTRELGPWGTGQ